MAPNQSVDRGSRLVRTSAPTSRTRLAENTRQSIACGSTLGPVVYVALVVARSRIASCDRSEPLLVTSCVTIR